MTLDLRTEINLGGTWTQPPATGPGSLRNTAPVTITRGRPDNKSSFVPASATFTLDNRDSRWTVRNPTGAWYGQLVQSTPIRFSVPVTAAGLSNYLRMEGDLTSTVTTPDKAGLQITGPIDIRVDCWPSDYSGNILAAKWGATAKSWIFSLDMTAANAFTEQTGTGGLILDWWDGSNVQHLRSNLPLPYFNQRICLRVLFTPSTGTAQFFTAPTMAGPFTQLGTNQVFGATTLSNGAGQAVQIGGQIAPFSGSTFTISSFLGMIYEAQIYNNVTLEVDPVFSAQTAGATSFTDSQSSLWTLNGTSEISSRLYRFHGELAALPKAAAPNSADANTQAQAGGVMRRLSQQQNPLNSAIYRAYLRLPSSLNLAAYWPGETGIGATVVGSALGGQSMQIAGSPNMGSNSDFACSAPLPSINGAVFTGNVTTPAGVTWTDNVVRFLYEVPFAGETNNLIVAAMTCTGGVGYATLTYTTAASGTLTFQAYSAPGGSALGSGVAVTGVNGQKLRVSMDLTNVSGSTEVTIEALTVGAATAASTAGGVVSASPPGVVTRVQFTSAGVMGHWSVQGTWDPLQNELIGPLNAWNGENAATRIARLCAEEGIACRIVGPQSLSQPMGNQTLQTLTSLLQECETTDQGMLFEPRQVLGLGYVTEHALCSQTALATAAFSGNVQPQFSAESDDTMVVNDITMTAADGSSSRQVLSQGPMSVASPQGGWQQAHGTVASPAAGAAIATTANVQPGTYTINWIVSLAGSVGASDVNNFGLFVGGTQIATSVNTGTVATFPQKPVTTVIAAAATIAVKAIGAGTASSSYTTVIPPASPGVGRFDTGVTINPSADAVTPDLAFWYLHVHSADEDRYPALPFQLARGTYVQAIAQLDIGHYLSITSPPGWVPPTPVRQVIAGYTETLGPQPQWLISFNGFPEVPYETAIADAFRAQTPGSFVHANTASGSGTFQADSTSDLWTQAAGDYPFDLLIAGQQITVSACTGSPSSTQTFTVSAWGVNGVTKNLVAGDQIFCYHRAYAGLS